MNRTKCRYCNLVNLASDAFCRRCGGEIGCSGFANSSARGPREAAKRSSWFYTIIIVMVLVSAGAYLYSGVEKSYEDVKAADANRIATQAKQQPEGLSSRSEADQKRAGQYGTAIQNSSGLSESQKHNEELKGLMQTDSNKIQK